MPAGGTDPAAPGPERALTDQRPLYEGHRYIAEAEAPSGLAMPPSPGQRGQVIRVLVAEDMQILRNTLVTVLNLEPDITVVADTGDGNAITPTAGQTHPDVAIIDIDMPGTDGLTAAAQLDQYHPACRVLILTVLGRPGNLRHALAAHVAGFLVKDTPADELTHAIRTVAAGGRVIDQQVAFAALAIPDNPLSPREREVLERFAAGAGTAQIAADAHLTYGTVRNYLASAVTKLGARNRVDAVRIAAETGWLQAQGERDPD
jgi:two-component system, NarL family, response regulator DesR